MDSPIPLTGSLFLEGPAGSGKSTEAAAYVARLIAEGIAPEAILVLVSQKRQGRLYQDAAHQAGAAGGAVEVLTYSALAQRSIQTFWPVVAEKANFANPTGEPVFLTIETAQFYMARLANPAIIAGDFVAVDLPPPRVISQTLDNLNRAAMLGITLDDVTKRLTKAWAEGPASRPTAYQASRDLAGRFRQFCLDNNLIDFSLAVELFNKILLKNRAFTKNFYGRTQYLIVDNVEEMNAAVHEFLKVIIPKLAGALIVYDRDAGYRIFLGAEPDNAYDLTKVCAETQTRDDSFVMGEPMRGLVRELARVLAPDYREQDDSAERYDPQAIPESFEYAIRGYYPEMIHWAADQIIRLVQEEGIAPGQIAVVAPFLNDSLRFTLTYRLSEAGIATLTHRPSRALRAEPVARAVLTLAQVAYPDPARPVPIGDIADALHQIISDLDPLRARVLAGYAYRNFVFKPFEELPEAARARVTFSLGAQYETLRTWLAENADPALALDHFIQLLFGDVLGQPLFRFHQDEEAGRTVAQLINSARTFRETLYPGLTDQVTMLAELRREYFGLFADGLLASDYAPNWIEESADAVFVSPAYTLLMHNRPVTHQFWLDIGSPGWSERIEQPLTHPYILRKENSAVKWTDDLEREEERKRLFMLVSGLARRCSGRLHLGIADLSEDGFEQKGLLLETFHNILRRAQNALAPVDDAEETDTDG